MHNSLTSSFIDEDGHTFKVRVRANITAKALKARVHRKSQKLKRWSIQQSTDNHVRSENTVHIAPESTKLVKVRANFVNNSEFLFVEKELATIGSPEDIYGCSDTLVSKESPFVYVSNFSRKPITIPAGQALSQGWDPSSWLDRERQFLKKECTAIQAHANLLRSIVTLEENATGRNPFVQTAKSKVKFLQDVSRQDYSANEVLAEPPLEGGPKTAEMPEESTTCKRLLVEVDISPKLTQAQKIKLQELLEHHEEAFGLEGRLGCYAEEVDIPLLPNTKPISILPYQASPVNRDVIDKQMDSWINLGVIEPSKSPWGAPVFIAYHNHKPRMVIDLRRLNKQVIADEFPLP